MRVMRNHKKIIMFAVLSVSLATIGVGHAQGPATGAGQTFPSKQVRFIVPFAAGGTIDIIGRLLSPSMSKTFGQQIVVEDRPISNSTCASAGARTTNSVAITVPPPGRSSTTIC